MLITSLCSSLVDHIILFFTWWSHHSVFTCCSHHSILYLMVTSFYSLLDDCITLFLNMLIASFCSLTCWLHHSGLYFVYYIILFFNLMMTSFSSLLHHSVFELEQIGFMCFPLHDMTVKIYKMGAYDSIFIGLAVHDSAWQSMAGLI